MKRSKLQILLVATIVILGITSCSSRIYDKDKLTIANTPFQKEDITFRTDGYYYQIIEYEQGENLSLEMEYGRSNFCAVSPIIFYDDGFVRKSEFTHGVKPFSKNEEKKDSIEGILRNLDKSIRENNFHVRIDNTIWDWGLYKQSENKLVIQYYYNHYGDYRLIDYSGIVKNDTTLVFKQKKGYTDFPSHISKIEDESEEIYYFRKLSVKPDSMNYIKSNAEEFGQRINN